MENEKTECRISGLSFETLNKAEEIIIKEIENGKCGFIELIQDSAFQFSTGLSYRMLNYYTLEGMLQAKRNSIKGKRRLSFFDIHALKYLVASRPKTSKLASSDFIDLTKTVLRAKDYNEDHVTQFELKLLSTLTLLGIKDIMLKTSGFKTDNKYQKLNYNLSKELMESITLLDLKIDKYQEFITRLIYEIDKLRSMLDLTVLCNENLIEIDRAPFITQNHKNRAIDALPKLLKMPICNNFNNYSSTYRHEDGMIYGMEITRLGHEDYLTPEDRKQFTFSMNELIIKTK
jgi:hypothetical protein